MNTIQVHDCDSRSPSHHCRDPMTMVVCPQNKLYSLGSFLPLKFLSRILFHIVDLVGNHLNSYIYIYLHSF